VKGNAPDDLLEDEDDDDFVLDWDELLQMGDEGPVDIQDDTPDDAPPEMLLPEPRGPRTRGRRKGAYIYQPKWLRWNYRERPLESTVRLQTRYLALWRWSGNGCSTEAMHVGARRGVQTWGVVGPRACTVRMDNGIYTCPGLRNHCSIKHPKLSVYGNHSPNLIFAGTSYYQFFHISSQIWTATILLTSVAATIKLRRPLQTTQALAPYGCGKCNPYFFCGINPDQTSASVGFLGQATETAPTRASA
jgi:hypothetical protein